MKNTILLTLLLFCINVNAQTRKTFTENYDSGTATYQYYEDSETSQMIKDGSFKYEKKITNSNPSGFLTVTITGKYKDGFRDGPFYFTIEAKDFPNSGDSYTTKKQTATLTYSKGIPNGLWEISGNWKSRQYKYNYQTKKHYWTEYSNNDSEYAKVHFENNIATGQFTFKNFNDKQKTSLNLNDKGFIVGDYDFSNINNFYNLSFTPNGLLKKNIITEVYTKKIETKEVNDDNTIGLAENYINGKMTSQELLENRISVDTVTNGLSFLDYKSIFEQEPFLMIHFSGDKSIKENDNATNRIYNRFINVRKFDFIDLDNDFAYRHAQNTRIDEEKVNNLTTYLEDNSFRLKPNDKVRVENLIAEIESKIQEKEELLRAKDLYYKNKDSLKSRLNEFRGFTFDGELSSISSESLKPFSREITQMNRELFNEYLSSSGSINYGYNEDKNFVEELEFINQGLKKYKQENFGKIIEFNKIKELAEKADLANYTILILFSNGEKRQGQQYEEIYSDFHDKSSPLSKEEEKIFIEYSKVQQELTERIKSTNDINLIAKSLKSSLNISETLISLKGNISKDYWKRVKKMKNIDEKIKVIIEK